MTTSSPPTTPPSPPRPFRLFPATDRPSQPLHDVRMAFTDVEALGCGAYGHVRLRLAAAGQDDDDLDFPARVVPCRGVRAGHVLMAEAAMAVFYAKMGSLVEVCVVEESEGECAEVTLHVTPLYQGQQQQQQQQQPPPHAILERATHALRAAATAKSLFFVRFLSLALVYRVVKVERRDGSSRQAKTTNTTTTTTTRVVLPSQTDNKTEKEAREKETGTGTSSSPSTFSFGAAASQAIMDVLAQSTARHDAFLMQGVLLSAPREAGKTFFLQQLQQQLNSTTTTTTVVYVRGKDVLEALMAADENGGGRKKDGGRDGGEEEEGYLRQRLGLPLSSSSSSFCSSDGEEEEGGGSIVLLIDDFDAILSGGDEGGREDEGGGGGGAATQEEMEEELQMGGREATRALKILQRLLKCPVSSSSSSLPSLSSSSSSSRRHRPLCWVLATRESLSGGGGGGGAGGGSRQRRLARLHGRLFDKVVELPPPRPEERIGILRHILSRTAPTLLPSECEEGEEGREEGEEGRGVLGLLQRVGEMTGGFLPGDLVTLCQVAALHALGAGAAAGAAAAEPAMATNAGREEGGGKNHSFPSFPSSSSYSRSLSAFMAARREVSPAVLSGLADRGGSSSSSSSSRGGGGGGGGGEGGSHRLCWANVGGYEDVKSRLKKLVEWPMLYAETFARLGLRPPSSSSSSSPSCSSSSSSSPSLPRGGILLYGPSGCGKSLLARVLAEEVKANFVELPASEVFSPFLGDSEARVRNAFARARRAAPCILFLDELDAMAAGRGVGGGGGEGGSGGVYARVLSTLLNEMDGVSGQAQGLLVLAATNRREAVDAALLRPGRLQESLLVPYPRPELDYLPILKVATRRMPLHRDVDLAGLVRSVLTPLLVEGGDGADGAGGEGKGGGRRRVVTPANLMALCREAGLACLRETDGEGEGEGEGEGGGEEVDDAALVVRQEHLVQAAAKMFMTE